MPGVFAFQTWPLTPPFVVGEDANNGKNLASHRALSTTPEVSGLLAETLTTAERMINVEGESTRRDKNSLGDVPRQSYFCKKRKYMSARDSISKESVLKSISEMPDRVSMEELFDRIIYLFKIEEGLAQSKRNEGTPIDQVREKMKTWRNEKSS